MTGLLDCNNFFVSCERLFRPDLAKKPVAVLSSNDGCIVARSQEVKDLGIPMGIPYFKVREECEKEGITLFSGNITLYRDISSRVMQTLKRHVSEYQVYSIDEAFFTLERATAYEEAIRIRNTIMQHVGIPVSIGIADTKTIAKYASEKVKKEKITDGVCVLETNDWLEESGQVSCGRIWGIGQKTSKKLHAAGILSVQDFLNTDSNVIKQQCGVEGERLRMELSGIPVSKIKDENEEIQKSIMSSRSFKKETKELSVLESSIGYHISHVATKLREKKCLATRLHVSIRPNRFGDYMFRTGSVEVVLPEPTASTQRLLTEALDAVRRIYDKEVPYKKVGVTVGGILPKGYKTNSLFEFATPDSVGDIDQISDSINKKFGRNVLHYAVTSNTKKWGARAELKSGEYTTCWGQIPIVSAV